jgi:hypothetical protein
MKLVKISDKDEIWVNPEFVNVILEIREGYTEVSTNYTRLSSELPAATIIERLGAETIHTPQTPPDLV